MGAAAKKRERGVWKEQNFELHVKFWWKRDPDAIGERDCQRSGPGSIFYGRMFSDCPRDCKRIADCILIVRTVLM